MDKQLKNLLVFTVGLMLIGSLVTSIIIIECHRRDNHRDSIYPSNKITSDELEDLLSAEFPNACIIITDSWYYLISKEEFDRLMQYDRTDQHKYIHDVYDCDDFAFDFWRNLTRQYHIAMGVAFINVNGEGHAINFYVDNYRRVYLVEPQTDQYIQEACVYYLLI